MDRENHEHRSNRSKRLRRGIYVLPSLFTTANIFCGFYAIINSMKGDFDLAALAIGFAILFDGLDGRIARLTHSTSAFGLEFDSLADVITFGIAPAVLAYMWGIRPVAPVEGSHIAKNLQQIGWVVAFAYLICGAARLARFNIQSLTPVHPAGLPQKKHFVGMPIPAAAGFIAAVVHFVWGAFKFNTLTEWQLSATWIVILAILAFLMVSTLRYPSFKDLDLRNRKPFVSVIGIGLLIAAIYYYSEYVLLILATIYAFSGLFTKVINWIRPHPHLPEPSTHPETH
ncbi:MAG: CDP-diacylglycerol--serine O-phosphatidyltransferase [Acidobacteriia bacterium]|nr:CDP-diacylglycerol--serine O-phosphatidyltransferase [Terriglobia bacterium]